MTSASRGGRVGEKVLEDMGKIMEFERHQHK